MILFKKLDLVKYIKNAITNNVIEILLYIIVIFGAVLRIYNLGSKSLWLDEIGQVFISKNSIPEVLEGASQHLSPPLDYIIIHFFLYFGDSEFIVRLPSAIFGILAIILIYKLGKTMFGPKEGLISALLLSVSPMHIWYSQEARMYSLFTFLSLLSLFFFYNAIKKNVKKLWIGFIISTLLNIYTHYFAFFVILVEMIFLFIILIKNRYMVQKGELSGNISKTTLSRFLISITIIFLFFTPWLNIFIAQTHGIQRVLYYGLQPNLFFFYYILKSISIYNGIGGLFNNGGINTNLILLIIELLYINIFIIFFLYGIVASIKKHKDQIILLSLWVMVPVVISFALSYYRGPMTTDRNLIFILPVYLIIISKGITTIYSQLIEKIKSSTNGINRIKNKQLTIGFLIIIILLFASMSILTIEQGYAKKKADWRGTADYLNTHTKEGELIIIFKDHWLHLKFYYDGEAEIITIKNITGLSIIKTSSDNYTKIWFVSSPHSGVNRELLNELNSNCIMERKGLPGGEGNLELGSIYSCNFNESIPQDRI